METLAMVIPSAATVLDTRVDEMHVCVHLRKIYWSRLPSPRSGLLPSCDALMAKDVIGRTGCDGSNGCMAPILDSSNKESRMFCSTPYESLSVA